MLPDAYMSNIAVQVEFPFTEFASIQVWVLDSAMSPDDGRLFHADFRDVESCFNHQPYVCMYIHSNPSIMTFRRALVLDSTLSKRGDKKGKSSR